MIQFPVALLDVVIVDPHHQPVLVACNDEHYPLLDDAQTQYGWQVVAQRLPVVTEIRADPEIAGRRPHRQQGRIMRHLKRMSIHQVVTLKSTRSKISITRASTG